MASEGREGGAVMARKRFTDKDRARIFAANNGDQSCQLKLTAYHVKSQNIALG